MEFERKKPPDGRNADIRKNSVDQKQSPFLVKNNRPASGASKTLQALTSAAIMLPGLMLPPAQAADENRINFQYSRYQEGNRNLFGAPNSLNPIRADVLHGSGLFALTDRTKFSFSYTQDTWSGATPVTTSPLAANGNRLFFENTEVGKIVAGASPYIKSHIL